MPRRVSKIGILLFLVVFWFMGCALCTKRLYIYRDTPEKITPTTNAALLITNPDLALAVLDPSQKELGPTGKWAEEKPSYDSDEYTLSVDKLDGRSVYQGLCLDTTPTYVCEVRPGSRQLEVRLDIMGPGGHEKQVQTVNLNLEPGKCYFLRPDPEALADKNLVLKVDFLKEPYTPQLRARIIDWERLHSRGKTLTD